MFHQELAFVIEAVEIINKVIIDRLLFKGNEGVCRYQRIHELVNVEFKGFYFLERGFLDFCLADPHLRGQQRIGDACRGEQAGHAKNLQLAAPEFQDQCFHIDVMVGTGRNPALGKVCLGGSQGWFLITHIVTFL
ncbi:hypothetical protein D3C84_652800 [compost metagenome]